MKIEQHFIDFIPESERRGHPRNLFAIWFSCNMMLLTIVTGSLGIIFGLNLFWSVAAILIGNLIGGVFMAAHSVQGPRLGVPQMIQSRAQFGVFGAVFPLIIVLLMYIGFYASNSVLGAQAMAGGTSVSLNGGIIIMSIITFVIALYGYHLIHKVEKYLAMLFAVVFVIVSIVAFRLPLPENSWSTDGFQLAPFLLSISIYAAWQLAYAPYVSDYSRYLPSNSSSKQNFWYSYAGTNLATIWMMTLGCVVAAGLPAFIDNASEGLGSLFDNSFSTVIYLVLVLGIIGTNVLNLYGAFMSLTTILETYLKIKSTVQNRFWLMFAAVFVATGLAIVGNGNFLNNFTNFILFLAYFMFPWTTINLVDFYFVRRGKYNVDALFDAKGLYGKYNMVAISAYVIAFLCEIPFINSTWFVGPLVDDLGGTDIAWIVGLIIPAIIYYFPMKKKVNMVPPTAQVSSTESA